VPGRRAAAPNPAGAHFLRDRALIAQLVRASGAGAGQADQRRLLRAAYRRRDEPLDRVLKGLGSGALTAGPAATALLARAGVSPRTTAAMMTADNWYAIGRQLARDHPAAP
jgi:hypothetical protein